MTPTLTALFVTALNAFVLAASMTRSLIPWLANQGAVASENHRTMHSGSIPKGGGLPLLAATLIALIATFPETGIPMPLMAGLALATAVSWWDDVRPLSALFRLPLHLAAASCFVLAAPPDALVFQGYLPLAADRILAIVVLAGFMNFFNFMDGINGIAGAQAVAMSAGYLLVCIGMRTLLPMAPLATALLGATLGFLIWNFRSKALVFLGDVGSVPLGYLTGAMMIDLASRGLWAPALILPAYFLVDANVTLLKRLLRGEKIWQAHRSHYYQTTARAFGSHLPVVWRISTANIGLIGVALCGLFMPVLAIGAAALLVIQLLWVLIRDGDSQKSSTIALQNEALHAGR